MKILLVSANTFNSPYPVYPLGLDYVSGAVSARHAVRIADMNVLKSLDGLRDELVAFDPDMVGVSVRNIDNTDATAPGGFTGQYGEIAETIRRHSKGVLVLGGAGFTIFPRELMALTKADFGIVGEGERFGIFMDAYDGKRDLSGVPGLVIRDDFGKAPPPWGGDIQRPLPPDGAHLDFYLKNGGMLNLQTKRGCRFRCVYCTYPHIEGRKLRLFPPDEVAETALRLQEAGARYFFVTDSAFNVDIRHSLEVAKSFKKKGVSIPWGAFFAPVELPDRYFEVMADAGLTHVEFGTESLCDSVLSAYQKPFRTEQVFAAHGKALDAGLYAAHYLLMGGPGENSESVDRTLSNVDKLSRTVIFFFSGMRIYPHTDLYGIAVGQGKTERLDNLLEPVFFEPDDIAIEEIVEKIERMAKGRPNWLIGAGGEETVRIVSKMHRRGRFGPLWEHLVG